MVAWAARAARVGVPLATAGLHVTRDGTRSVRSSEKKTAGLKKFISLNK